MNEKEKESIEEFRKQLRLAINIDDVTTNIRNDNAQTILNLIEKLQKENEELKIIKSAIQTLQINSMEDEKYIVISKGSFLDGSYKHLLDDYIPIQKVKDKIREEEKENKEKYGNCLITMYEDELVNRDIKILQELLEGRK